ncbi:MAG TPA: hypothetical protein VMI94_01505 [Bryobacteraceae bacterium]|nr:hypothetical protein [Bryobacteraceae bacterium]
MTSSSSCPPVGDPNAIAKRLIQRAHNRDGLPEIAMGLSFLVVGILSYALVLLPRDSIGFKAAVVGLALLIPVLGMGSPWALKWVRRRYLIERVGYVEPKPICRKQIGAGIAVAVVAATLLFGVVTQSSNPDRWVLAGTGLFGGALAAWAGQLPRFVIGGVLMAATGMVVAFAGVSLEIGFAVIFGFQGLLALISGGMVFLRFIRQPIEPGE